MPSSCASSSRGRRHNSRSAAALKPADSGKRRAKGTGKAKAQGEALPWPLLVHVPRSLRSSSEVLWGRKGRRTSFRDQAQRPAPLLLPLHEVYAKAARMEPPLQHKEKLPCKRKGVPDNAALSPAAAALGEGRHETWRVGTPPPPPTCSPSPSPCWEQQQQEPYTFEKFGWNSHSPPGSPFELRPSSPRKRRFTKSAIISGRHADAQAERQQAALVEQREQQGQQEQREQQAFPDQQQQPFCLPPNQELLVELQRQGDRHWVKKSSHGALSIIHRGSTPTRITPSHMDATGLDFQSTFATVNKGLAQWHANVEGRKPVRRCLFDSFLAGHNAGQVSEQPTPILDQGAALAHVTRQDTSQALRTPSPPPGCFSPGYGGLYSQSPPTFLSVNHGTGTLFLHHHPQPQQQGGGVFEHRCKLSQPDAAHFDLNSVPTPECKPRRRKYVPKVVKERKARVRKTPRPGGDRVSRPPGRPRKQKKQQHNEPQEEQRLAEQEPFSRRISTNGVVGDQDLGLIINFARGGSKRKEKHPSRRSGPDVVNQQGPHVQDWPDIVSKAQDIGHHTPAHPDSGSTACPLWPQVVPSSPANYKDTLQDHPGENRISHHDPLQWAHLDVTPMASIPATLSIPDHSSIERTSMEELGLATCSSLQNAAQAEPLCTDLRLMQHLPLALLQQELEPVQLMEASGCTDDNRLALVLHNGVTDLMLYQDPLLKKKKPRGKVVLDEATLRCWNLLMGKRQPETIDQDGVQSKKWEEERAAMKRQVDRFLDRTHQVQGDHTFCLWNGSIVDSVVGAFLTQNVSDQLSSSAFMALAARYPVGCRKAEGNGEAKGKEDDQVKLPEKPEIEPAPLALEQHTSAEQFPECHLARILDNVRAQGVPGQEVLSRVVNNVQSNCTMQLCASSSAESTNNILTEDNRTCGSFVKSDAGSDGEECRDSPFPEMASVYASSLPSELQADGADEAQASCRCQGGRDTNLILTIDLNLGASSGHCRSFDSQEFSSTGQDMPATVSPSQLEAESGIVSEQRALDRRGLGQGYPYEPRGEGKSSLTDCETCTSLCSVSVRGNAGHCEVATTCPEQDRTICNSADVHPLPIASLPPCASAIQDTVVGGPALLQGVNNRKPRKGYSHLSGLERAHMEAKQGGNKSKTDWEVIRAEVVAREAEKRAERGPVMDAVDWEAVRQANLDDIAGVIKERGMNYMLAGRISAFLDRICKEHGSIDLEWLRETSVESAKEFLLSIRGLGLKSVECIRLLTLHHRAFPVDTNVGRICVRLGWVPLEPLPEELQLHLLELYPVQANIQQYLWPRLCTLDQNTLYELHYQMITFGKVFCTKSKPNCHACPMRSDCRHYASSSRAKLLIKGPEGDMVRKEIAQLEWSGSGGSFPDLSSSNLALEGPVGDAWRAQLCEPIVDVPMTPEPVEPADTDCSDIEDSFYWSGDGMLMNAEMQVVGHMQHERNRDRVIDGVEDFVLHSQNSSIESTSKGKGDLSVVRADATDDSTCTSQVLLKGMVLEVTDQLDSRWCAMADSMSEPDDHLQSRKELVSAISRELVVIPPEIACRPPTQLKRYGRLRTVHNVYEVPDNHPILREVEPRDVLDPYVYLFAIWGPGEGTQSPTVVPSDSTSGNCIDKDSETVKGTLLIPCRTALRGTFPLNGTYFQKNEVFADHDSSLEPLIVSRALLWNLRRRLVYFGTTATNIYRNLTMDEIQACGWAACICVRGFERRTRAPKPLVGRLHYPASKVQALKRAAKKNCDSALKLQLSESTTAATIG